MATLAMFGLLPNAFAVDPLYQWNFNSANGANTGTGSGGTLAANVGSGTGDWTSGSFSGAGVSGAVGDNAYQGYNSFSDYWGNFYSDAGGLGNLNLTGLNQFTITMWIKRSGGNTPDILNIGSTTTPGSSSNPGISIGFDWGDKMRVGVNGANAWLGDFWGAGSNNGQWVFLAIAYDGNAGFGWTSTAMSTTYGATRNMAIITGDTTTAASISDANAGVHNGGWWDGPGAPAVGATATAFIGNNGSDTAGYSGQLDDIRIYSSLLSVSEIDAVRLQAVQPVPEPSTLALAVAGGAALLFLRRRTIS